MKILFRYKCDRRARRFTWIIPTVLAPLYCGAFLLWGPEYIPAWITIFSLCLLTLLILSIPRYISLDDNVLEIHCVVEMTRIHVEDIESVRRIRRADFKRLWPILGSYGFGGYFGYYFSFFDWTFYKLYAAERRQLVLIEDIYEDRYVVSCPEPDWLVSQLIEARDRKREEILRTSSGGGNAHTGRTNRS